mmetsp:Transcript_76010/g.180866  ORF Transcript_76010/g.180866 Transcript_76010/m.180866 type:complete len:395 (+) Transcript_76010:116-1300(+)|eukprot:CAMPEP_0178426746 /NCGR_PEP_ID=MMETSP0689_2-20121128/29391_1 /TAXON_ID=160604 /ORGANISM="Amphidinium massartii, Strain CS-259" /LENGTH=394 /DNA_ID=CAMNT_0020048437 /DNA_START=235 /DNA_END=1419 /DNA_ORIENTATION=+
MPAPGATSTVLLLATGLASLGSYTLAPFVVWPVEKEGDVVHGQATVDTDAWMTSQETDYEHVTEHAVEYEDHEVSSLVSEVEPETESQSVQEAATAAAPGWLSVGCLLCAEIVMCLVGMRGLVSLGFKVAAQQRASLEAQAETQTGAQTVETVAVSRDRQTALMVNGCPQLPPLEEARGDLGVVLSPEQDKVDHHPVEEAPVADAGVAVADAVKRDLAASFEADADVNAAAVPEYHCDVEKKQDWADVAVEEEQQEVIVKKASVPASSPSKDKLPFVPTNKLFLHAIASPCRSRVHLAQINITPARTPASADAGVPLQCSEACSPCPPAPAASPEVAPVLLGSPATEPRRGAKYHHGGRKHSNAAKWERKATAQWTPVRQSSPEAPSRDASFFQ